MERYMNLNINATQNLRSTSLLLLSVAGVIAFWHTFKLTLRPGVPTALSVILGFEPHTHMLSFQTKNNRMIWYCLLPFIYKLYILRCHLEKKLLKCELKKICQKDFLNPQNKVPHKKKKALNLWLTITYLNAHFFMGALKLGIILLGDCGPLLVIWRYNERRHGASSSGVTCHFLLVI